MTKNDREQLARNIVENYIKNGNPGSVEKMTSELLEDWDIWDEFINDMKAEE